MDIKDVMVVNFAVGLINQEDFNLFVKQVENNEKVFYLKDLQEGNLGGLNQETFFTLGDVIDRLEIYHEDYIYRSLDERRANAEEIPSDDWDLIAAKFIESNEVAEILLNVNVEKYLDIVKQAENLDFTNDDCEKYISDMLNNTQNQNIEEEDEEER